MTPEIELTLTPEEQAIADKATGKEIPKTDDEEEIKLPSETPKEGDEPKKFADKYETVEDLRKGIDSIGSDLPEYVLEGMSDEALEKHYQELQKGFHDEKSARKHTAKNEEGEGNEKGNEDDTKDKPAGVPEKLWTELGTHFEENGNITEEHYEQLNKAGIPDDVIDRYIDSIQNEQIKFTQEIHDIAGGEQEYNTIKAWAEDNISPEKLNAISRMDKNGMVLAMEGIKAKYDAANPSDGVRIIGDTKNTSAGAYHSQADYIIDVSDRRYGSDKRYTKAVDDKFSNSKNLQ